MRQAAICRRAALCPASIAFKLYDTYGFPLDLTQDALRDRALHVDVEGFQTGDGAPARRGTQGLGRFRRIGDRGLMVRHQGENRSHRVFGLRHGAARKASSPRSSRTARRCRRLARASPGRSSSIKRPFMANWAAKSATRVSCARTEFASVSTIPRKNSAVFLSMKEVVEEGELRVGLALELVVDHAAPASGARQSFGDPSSARGAPPGARRTCGAKGIARRTRPASLRLHASKADRLG